ncbi:MAG: TIGR02186 family protein [Rickettsiales bacterium]
MNKFYALYATCIILVLSFIPAVHATPIIADLSQYRIDIDARFNGTRLFLFGVRNNAGDVVVVVRGPKKHFLMRKKEPIAGIWVNSDRMKFYNMPDFYAIATSKQLNKIEQTSLFKQLGIGQRTLFLEPSNPSQFVKFIEYSDAFIKHQQARKLYMELPAKLDFMGETLFKTSIDFPDTIPPGDYTAEIYLLKDGEVSGMQSTPITVSKTGLDEFLHSSAHEHPALYGLAAILIALSAGWVAGRVFE